MTNLLRWKGVQHKENVEMLQRKETQLNFESQNTSSDVKEFQVISKNRTLIIVI